jgi:hypothetical protein
VRKRKRYNLWLGCDARCDFPWMLPDDIETKDLLLRSLKGWEFRPSSRDGEPTAVEVLLIIPRKRNGQSIDESDLANF